MSLVKLALEGGAYSNLPNALDGKEMGLRHDIPRAKGLPRPKPLFKVAEGPSKEHLLKDLKRLRKIRDTAAQLVKEDEKDLKNV